VRDDPLDQLQISFVNLCGCLCHIVPLRIPSGSTLSPVTNNLARAGQAGLGLRGRGLLGRACQVLCHRRGPQEGAGPWPLGHCHRPVFHPGL
jgi:hypothetical protein